MEITGAKFILVLGNLEKHTQKKNPTKQTKSQNTNSSTVQLQE